MNHEIVMIIHSKRIFSLAALLAAANFILIPTTHATINVASYWRCGEQDPGAAPGLAATNTLDLVGGRTFSFLSAPVYDSGVDTNAAADTGSSLCLRFTTGNYGIAPMVSNVVDYFGLELWVKSATSSGNQCLAYNGNTSSNGWGLYQIGSTYQVLFGGVALFGSGSLVTNAWTHLALVRDGGLATLYVNGVAAGATGAGPGAPAGAFSLGAPPNKPTVENFSGMLDEVRTFTFAAGQFSINDLLLSTGPPMVASGTASNPTSTSATLNGSVNPHGLATTAWFRWGTTASYGNSTAMTNLPATNLTFAVASGLSGLAHGTTSHFAVVAANSAGTNQGTDQTFVVPSLTTSLSESPVLYSTFGPNYAYSYLVESRYAASAFYIAMPFSPKFTAALGHIIVPVYNVFTPSQIRFTLTADNNGVPGTTLETWSVIQPIYGSLTTLKSVHFPTLNAGVPYWLVASADDPNTQSYWWIGPLNGSTPAYNLSSTNQGATWSAAPVTDCAFEVDGANPIITSVATASTNLTLTATNGIAGRTYLTLRGTNMAQPVHLWQPVATNLLNLDGAFTISATNAVITDSPQQYYILKME